MNLSDLKKSKFLKRSDVGRGMLVTIARLAEENVAVEGADPEMRHVLYFDELDKGLVLNSTNANTIAYITKCEEDIEHNWVGKAIVLYDDPGVQFKGKMVGGIRVRAPKPGSVKPAAAPAIEEDPLPF